MKIKKLINWLPKVGYYINSEKVKTENGSSISNGGSAGLTLVGIISDGNSKSSAGNTKVQGGDDEPSPGPNTLTLTINQKAALELRKALEESIKDVTWNKSICLAIPFAQLILSYNYPPDCFLATFRLSNITITDGEDGPYISGCTFSIVQGNPDKPEDIGLGGLIISYNQSTLVGVDGINLPYTSIIDNDV